jgi:phosphatidylglycerol:prolipoprotein diacylglycerol transferase
MLTYPQIDPVAFALGPLKIHWYGIMYLVGFFAAWALLTWRARKPDSGWTSAEVSDLVFYCALGVVIGGRLGYMLFYDFHQLFTEPLSILRVWQGGMSFHGGLLGVVFVVWWFARRYHKSFITIGDFIAPVVPIGLAAGRIGNFINGELWGRVTTMSWGMIFPSGGPLPRHPSQLYEFALEGILLFLILWIYSEKRRPPMAVGGLFLLLYGFFRFICELFRMPDPQLGYLVGHWMTMGQLLSLPMMLVGLVMWVMAHKKEVK